MDNNKRKLWTIQSNIVLAGRLKILWEYVIWGKKPQFTISAWVYPQEQGPVTIKNLRIITTYPKKQGDIG